MSAAQRAGRASEPSSPKTKKEAPSPPVVLLDAVTGTTRIDPRTLARKLGRTNFDVWTALLWCRDKLGFTRVRNARLLQLVNARREREARRRISLKTIHNATARLKEIGLLETAGQETRTTVCRRVYGDYRKGVATFPRVLCRVILERAGHGGRREGSGRRPSKHAVINWRPEDPNMSSRRLTGQVKYVPFLSFDSTCDGNQVGQPSGIKLGSLRPVSPQKTRGDTHTWRVVDDALRISDLRSNDLSSKEERIAQAREALISSESRSGREKVAAVIRSKVDEDRWGRYIEEEEPPEPIEKGVMPAARIPSPKAFDDEMSDLEMAWALIKLYRGCVERKYGGRCMVYANVKDITQAKHYAKLVEAGDCLRDLGIPPAAWIGFRVDWWRSEISDRTIIPLNKVFDADTILNLFVKFRHMPSGLNAYASDRGRAGPMSEAEKTLCNKYALYNRAKTTLMMNNAWNERTRKETLRKHFPDGWVAEYERVRAQLIEDQAELYRQHADFVYMWD